MAGFRKAKAEQAYLKMSMYGPPGSGKTFTAHLVAEGLARHAGRRVAAVDTERGMDFYAQAVPERPVHPEAFDFDVLHTRSLTECLRELRSLSPEEYGVVIVDSISHLWDAAKASYAGPKTRIGTIPMQAWSRIKAPYKALMEWLINCPLHVLILGRQANEFAEDESGETKAVGVKMRAEGETAYEPHICLRMEAVRPPAGKGRQKAALAVVTAFAEKDRTGVLQGRLIESPDFDSLARPLLPLLGGTQAQVQGEDDAAAVDSQALAEQEREKALASRITREQFEARLKLAAGVKEVVAIGKEITPEVKRRLTPADVAGLRESYLGTLDRAKGRAMSDPDGAAERQSIEQE